MLDLVNLEILTASLVRWGPYLLFVSMFVECLPIVGFVVPGLTLLVVGGFVAVGQPILLVFLMLVGALAGLLAADTLMFWLGRAGADRMSFVRRLVEKHDAFRQEIDCQSLPVLMAYQFPPYSRMFAPVLMGALSFSWRRWMLIVTTGSLAFVVTFFGLGFAVGVVGRDLAGAVSAASTISALFVLCLLVWVALLAFKLHRRRRHASGRVT